MDSKDFDSWWQAVVREHGYDPDPDSPLHFYDYRKAFETLLDEPPVTSKDQTVKDGHGDLILKVFDSMPQSTRLPPEGRVSFEVEEGVADQYYSACGFWVVNKINLHSLLLYSIHLLNKMT